MAPRTWKEIAAEQTGESWSPGQPATQNRLHSVQPIGELGVPQGNLRDTLTGLIASALPDDRTGYGMARQMMKLGENTPLAAATMGSDAWNDYQNGNYGSALLNAGMGAASLMGVGQGSPGGMMAGGALMMAPELWNYYHGNWQGRGGD